MLDYYDQHGKRHWETVRRNKKDAEKLLIRRLSEIEKGTFSTEDITFSDFANMWLENYARINVKDSTYVSYEKHIRNHLKPFFRDMGLKKITPLHTVSYTHLTLPTN